MLARGSLMFALVSACVGLLGSHGVAGAEPDNPGKSPIYFTLGADLGLSILHPTDGGDDETVLSWPNNPLAYLPGFRVGLVAGPSQEHAVYLKTGYLSFSDGGSFHILSLTGNYQYSFPMEGTISPYLTAGLGFVNVGGDGDGATSSMMGGGIGARFVVAEGHGATHLEARFDHVSEGDTSIEPAHIYSFQFGFDLWIY